MAEQNDDRFFDVVNPGVTTTTTGTTSYFNPAGTMTQDEYQTGFIDFYNMPTITDPVVIGDEEEEEEEQDVQPNVLAPVKSDDDKPTIFGAGVTLGGESSFDFKTKDFNEVINDYVDPSKAAKDGAKKEKSFSEFGKAIADMYKTPEGAIGSGVGFMMGLGPLGGPALSAMAQLNRKKQKETADAISATGGSGGTMFELNGQLVYRKPGEKFFSGVFEGTQKQMAGLEHMSKGFLPGMMKEIASARPDAVGVYEDVGKEALVTATGVAMDAYGSIFGSDGTTQGVTATQATKAREEFANKIAASMGYTSTLNSDQALDLKQALNEHMKQFKTGLFHKTSSVDDGTYNSHLEEAKKFSSSFVKNILGETPAEKKQKADAAKKAAEEKAAADKAVADAAAAASAAEMERILKEQKANKDDPGGDFKDKDTSSGGYDVGGGSGAGGSYGLSHALGGRVGLKEGGVAASQAGFVERPPSQVSEAATVADDKPMSVDDGTFVINAAAVEFAGEKDIMEMLNVAYKKAEKKGVQPPSEEMLEVAVSRGEVIVPAFLAKIIGYDRLEKINNRGKKEVNQRIKENGQQPVGAAGGGFLAGPFEKKKTELTAADLEAQDYFSELEQSNPEQFAAIQQLDAELEESLLSIADRDPVFMAGLEGKQSISEFVAPVTGAITQEDKEAGAFSRATNPSSQAMNQPQGFVKMQTRGQGHPVAGVTYQQMDDVPYERVLIHEIMHKGADQIEKNRGAFKQLTDLITGKLGVHMVRKGRAEHKYINSVLNTVAMRRGADVDELTQAVRRSFLTYMDRDEREQALLNNEGISVQTKENNRGKRTDRLRIETKDPEVLKQILTNLNEIMMQDVVAKRLATRAQQHSSATR